MKNYNEVIKEIKKGNTITKLYRKLDGSFYVIKRDLEGYILKSKFNISYSDSSSTNEYNALDLLKTF